MFLLWLPSNWAFSSVIAPVNGFLFQFFASDADFYLRALRTTFWPVLVKLPCFLHYLSESNHFLGVVSKLHFWCFILPKTCFGLVAARLQASSFMSQKQPFSFSLENTLHKLNSTKNIFWLVGNEIELVWALYRKNQRFCFFLAKPRCTQLYSTKKNVLVCLP